MSKIRVSVVLIIAFVLGMGIVAGFAEDELGVPGVPGQEGYAWPDNTYTDTAQPQTYMPVVNTFDAPVVPTGYATVDYGNMMANPDPIVSDAAWAPGYSLAPDTGASAPTAVTNNPMYTGLPGTEGALSPSGAKKEYIVKNPHNYDPDNLTSLNPYLDEHLKMVTQNRDNFRNLLDTDGPRLTEFQRQEYGRTIRIMNEDIANTQNAINLRNDLAAEYEIVLDVSPGRTPGVAGEGKKPVTPEVDFDKYNTLTREQAREQASKPYKDGLADCEKQLAAATDENVKAGLRTRIENIKSRISDLEKIYPTVSPIAQQPGATPSPATVTGSAPAPVATQPTVSIPTDINMDAAHIGIGLERNTMDWVGLGTTATVAAGLGAYAAGSALLPAAPAVKEVIEKAADAGRGFLENDGQKVIDYGSKLIKSQ